MKYTIRWPGSAAAMLLAATLIGGCASPTAADYAGQKPVLDIRQYLNGELTAHGLFRDRSGKVMRRFVVQLTGTWQGSQGTLDERFSYTDGQTERRVWHITDEGGGHYTGRADDVVGTAVGTAAGNALNWRYTLALPVDGTVYDVQFDDWMFLVDERVMLNVATVSKFGFKVGEVTLSFDKPKP